jgi:hypothetical protein
VGRRSNIDAQALPRNGRPRPERPARGRSMLAH